MNNVLLNFISLVIILISIYGCDSDCNNRPSDGFEGTVWMDRVSDNTALDPEFIHPPYYYRLKFLPENKYSMDIVDGNHVALKNMAHGDYLVKDNYPLLQNTYYTVTTYVHGSDVMMVLALGAYLHKQ